MNSAEGTCLALLPPDCWGWPLPLVIFRVCHIEVSFRQRVCPELQQSPRLRQHARPSLSSTHVLLFPSLWKPKALSAGVGLVKLGRKQLPTFPPLRSCPPLPCSEHVWPIDGSIPCSAGIAGLCRLCFWRTNRFCSSRVC